MFSEQSLYTYKSRVLIERSPPPPAQIPTLLSGLRCVVFVCRQLFSAKLQTVPLNRPPTCPFIYSPLPKIFQPHLTYGLCMMQRAEIAQLVQRLATGSNLGGGEIFSSRLDWLWGPPSLLHNGYRIFPGDKAAGSSR